VRSLPGIEVLPDPTRTPMMHLLLRTDAARFRTAALRLAEQEGIWTWSHSQPTASPSVQRVELAVGDATLTFSPAEVRGVLERLLATA